MRSTFVFAVSTLFSGLVAATPLRNLKERAVAIEAYDYAGCYTEATFGRALAEKTTYDDLMTNQLCAASCVGYTWFGTEYGREVRTLPVTYLHLLIQSSAFAATLSRREARRLLKSNAPLHVLVHQINYVVQGIGNFIDNFCTKSILIRV